MADARTIRNMLRCADGLTLYAVERDNGMESGNRDTRNKRIRELLSGMTVFYELPESILDSFDSRLEAARNCLDNERASLQDQHALVRGLSRFAADLELIGEDPRSELLQIWDQFADMAVYRSWDVKAIRLAEAWDRLDNILNRLTAQQNIVFTRIYLSGEDGPALSDFEGGVLIDAEGVASTYLFDDMRQQYPEIKEWTAHCTVWQAGYGEGTPIPATEMDLDIMRRLGDDVLQLEGITSQSEAIEVIVKACPEQEQGPIMKL